MRKLVIAIAVVIGIIIVALLAIPRFVSLEKYRPRIQAELQQKLGRKVTFGEMHLSLLPPSFRVDNATIAEDPNFGQGNFATVQQLDVRVKLLPLLRSQVDLSSVRLQHPQIELIRNAQGVWNFSTIGEQNAGQQNQAQQAQQKQPAQQNVVLGELRINDGSVALTDQQNHLPRAVYNHIDVDLKNFAPDRQFTVDATVHLPGQGNEVATLNATAGPIHQGDMLQTPLDGTLKLQRVSLDSVQKFLNSQALAGTNAIVTGDIKVKNQNGRLASDGNVRLEQAKVKGTDIGYPIEADYNITDDLNSGMLQISKANLKLGATPLSVTGSLNTKPTPALLDVKLNASEVSLKEIARLAAAFGVAFTPGVDVAGTANADVHAQGAANNPVLNGTVTAKNVVMTGKDLPVPVKVPGVELSLTPQAIQSNDFTANAGGTNVAMKFALAQYSTPAPTVDATLKTANANVSELLAIAKAYGVSAVQDVNGSGTLNLDVHATGPIKQPDRMNFAGTGKLVNASLKPATMTQPVNVRNADLNFTSNGATLNNLAASLAQTNVTGSATVRNFAAPNLQFNLSADQVNITQLQQIMGGPAQQQQQQQHRASLIPAANAAPAPPASAAKQQPSMLAKLTGGGTLAAGKIIQDQLEIDNVRANVAFNNGVVKVAPLTGALYGGQVNGAITANMLTTPTAMQVQTQIQRVDANRLLSATTSVKDQIYGLLGSSGNLSFASGGSTDLAKTLNGVLNVNLLNGKISKLDLLNQLAAIGKFTGARQNATAVTNVAKLTGTFNIRNGVATTNNLQAVIDGGTLAANGSVNLASQALDMKLTAVLSKNMSSSVGGTGVGGFMQTALANNRGELVIPVLVTGTMDNPHFEPDVEAVAQMKLKNLLPTTGNPGQLSAGVVGALLGGNKGQTQGPGGILGAIAGQGNQQQNQQNQAGQQQQQEQNPLAGALGGLLGGKKKPEQQQQQKKQKPPQ